MSRTVKRSRGQNLTKSPLLYHWQSRRGQPAPQTSSGGKMINGGHASEFNPLRKGFRLAVNKRNHDETYGLGTSARGKKTFSAERRKGQVRANLG